MPTTVNHIYTSVACNRTPESLDWGAQNLIVYAASSAIVVYDPSQRRVLRTVLEHCGRVNTVKWMQSASLDGSCAVTLISGSDDHQCIVHRITDIYDDRSASVAVRLAGHTDGVKLVDSLPLAESGWLLATASSDTTLKLWHLHVGAPEAKCIQTLEFKRNLCLSLRLFGRLSGAFLAVGAGDRIELHRQQADDQFVPYQTLIGHEDWVRGLDVLHTADESILLASSSQDTFIRLWRCSAGADRFELESVLSGHDGWVYGVQLSTDGERVQLLSCSMDKTMILWKPNADDGIWMESVRMGDIGGHFLGFFGAKMSPTLRSLIGHGYHGSFHLWTLDEASERCDDFGQRWQPEVLGIGGHFGETRDLAWEPNGRFLLTLSADQTTRVHAPVVDASTGTAQWHELARPQVHGYDMQTLAVLSAYRFASGAEEKIVRAFQAPAGFVRSLRAVCGSAANDTEGDRILNSMSKGATLPSLGLSNQATVPVEDGTGDETSANSTDSVAVRTEPPTEETLMQDTLWPEMQKLYGHGYEVFALCASPDGRLLASACKATNAEHAQIIVWNTQTWKQHQQLAAHQLTVTQMRFSPDGRFLLSVSRDRRWAVFERQSTPAECDTSVLPEYALLESTNKTNGLHARIIWTCDWSQDSKHFATASRDGKCVMWHPTDADHPSTSSLKHFTALDVLDLPRDSLTAVAFAIARTQKLIAIGTEMGTIHLYAFESRKWCALQTIANAFAHHGTVRRLAFRPAQDDEHFELASCGNDSFVRLYKINLQ